MTDTGLLGALERVANEAPQWCEGHLASEPCPWLADAALLRELAKRLETVPSKCTLDEWLGALTWIQDNL